MAYLSGSKGYLPSLQPLYCFPSPSISCNRGNFYQNPPWVLWELPPTSLSRAKFLGGELLDHPLLSRCPIFCLRGLPLQVSFLPYLRAFFSVPDFESIWHGSRHRQFFWPRRSIYLRRIPWLPGRIFSGHEGYYSSVFLDRKSVV